MVKTRRRWTGHHRRFTVSPVNSTFISSLAFCGFAFMFAGCSATEAPDLVVRGGAVSDRSDEALVVDFDLHLHNPNSEPLELLEMNYVMNIDGRRVFEARRDAQATLPAGGDWTLRVPAVIPFDAAGWNASSIPPDVRYDVSGSLVYSAPGPLAEILLDAGIWRPKAGFDAEGALNLREGGAMTAVTVDSNP